MEEILQREIVDETDRFGRFWLMFQFLKGYNMTSLCTVCVKLIIVASSPVLVLEPLMLVSWSEVLPIL